MRSVLLSSLLTINLFFSCPAIGTTQTKSANPEEIVDAAAGLGQQEAHLTLKLRRTIWNGVKPLRVSVIVENTTNQDILYDMRCQGGFEGALFYEPPIAGKQVVGYTVKFDSELRKRANCQTIKRKDCDVIPAGGNRVYTLTSIETFPETDVSWKRRPRGVYTLQIVRNTDGKPLPFRGDSGPGLSQVVLLRVK